jgi:sugar phosphate isomerase/epimerase
MNDKLSRRQLLAASGSTLGAGLLCSLPNSEPAVARASEAAETPPFQFCLNMSTVRGQQLGVVKQVELAAKAGYDSIEPWMREIDAFVKEGGKLKDLGKQIRDAGLTVESAIGFARWIVDDDNERKMGLEQAKRDMDTLKQIGGKRIAAPPVGATNQTDLDLFAAADRYRALLELGREMDVIPQAEVWGFSKSLSRLGETTFVAVESGHPDACLLPDVYHIFKGGSDFNGLKLLGPQAIHVFHMNDYPAAPPRKEMNDSHRVYPGDGVAPIGKILRTLRDNGCRCVLSLELFNRDYWKQDPMVVAKTGLEKMRTSVAKAFA